MNKDTSISKFWWLVGYSAHQHPEWRAGQNTFNVLFQVRPDLSEQIRGGSIDAFHSDGGPRLDAMCQWIEENWAK